MNRSAISVLLFLLTIGYTPRALVADMAPAIRASWECKTCHKSGSDISPRRPVFPELRGLDQNYLVQQLRWFKDGTKPNEVMYLITKDLKDSDLVGLAQYFSSQQKPK